jgi:acyl carrier protein phosphodiesterase
VNFLAHIYLSGTNDLIKIGNFSADGIRGKAYLDYPKDMQVGILLHRKIDSFTDNHPLFRQSCRRLYPIYRHYSRVIVDIYYDHFLARNWHQYAEQSLESFVSDFYDCLEEHMALLPPKFQHLTPHMISGNWLVSYAHLEGIASVLQGMDRRSGMQSKMSLAISELKSDYVNFQNDFEAFFKDLTLYAHEELDQLQSDML